MNQIYYLPDTVFLKYLFKKCRRKKIISSVSVDTICAQIICNNSYTSGNIYL